MNNNDSHGYNRARARSQRQASRVLSSKSYVRLTITPLQKATMDTRSLCNILRYFIIRDTKRRKRDPRKMLLCACACVCVYGLRMRS